MRPNHRISRRSLPVVNGLLISSLVLALVLPTNPVHADAPRPHARPATYTVENGDTLYTIARQLGVPLDQLLAANGLKLDSLILPGATLVVPGGAAVAAPAPQTRSRSTAPAAPAAKTPLTYTVQAGDGLYTIAYRHGVSLTSLMKTNDLTPDDVVHPGTVLTIPEGGHAPASGSSAPAPAPVVPAVTPAAPASATPRPGTTYTVQANDGLYTIAYRHGVSLTALLEANDLTLNDVVHPGTILSIPAGGRPPQQVAPAAVAAAPGAPAAAPAPVAAPASSALAASSTGGSVNTSSASSATSAKIDTVIAFARAQLGKPYQFAAAGPDAFDCSGLTTAAYRQVGVYLPQQSLMQSARGTAVDWTTEPIRPGDLVFINRSGTDFIGHVGIAISSTMWIHAPREGDVVKIGLLPRADKIQAVRRYVNP